jgi:hypothetical protein
VNIAVVTLDSLRYDVAAEAPTRNLRSVFERCGAGSWRKVYAPATYTLPSHLSLLQGAIGPSNFGPEPVYNRTICSFFKIALPWRSGERGLYEVGPAENVVRGFRDQGYRTVGIGGVGWFNPAYATSNFWRGRFFEEFYWDDKFSEHSSSSFEHQLETVGQVLDAWDQRPLFFFLNVAATHAPYRGEEASTTGQGKALQYVDEHWPELIARLPRPCHVLLISDHGDCFGEDGRWGHAFYHEKVMEVPMIHFVVP